MPNKNPRGLRTEGFLFEEREKGLSLTLLGLTRQILLC